MIDLTITEGSENSTTSTTTTENESVLWVGEAGLELYWYPINLPLSQWTSQRVQAIESPSTPGSYTATLDPSVGTIYYLFVGSTEPASLNLAIAYTQLGTPTTSSPESSSAETLRGFSQAYGPKRVKTPNMEVEQFDPLTAQKAMERQSVVSPSFGSFGMTIVSPNLPKFRRH